MPMPSEFFIRASAAHNLTLACSHASSDPTLTRTLWGAGLDPSFGAPAESGFGSPVSLASALQPAGSAAVVAPAAVALANRLPAVAGDDVSPEGGVITSPWNDEDEVGWIQCQGQGLSLSQGQVLWMHALD